MKRSYLRIIASLLLVCVLVTAIAACGKKEEKKESKPESEHIDYVAATKLDLKSTDTQKYEVKWGERSHIDGDTSHFTVPYSFDSSGIVKARYLAVDTPESTGQIEQWGKAASRFTQEKLSTAVSIYIESDGPEWTRDGNGRYLCWVWYQPEVDADYRCLNIELLQNGLGASSSASEGRYGEAAVNAIDQATREKLYMFSGEPDPEYPGDEIVSLTTKELRTHMEEYENRVVAVEGIVTFNSDYTVYIESYDGETNLCYGVQVFYGYNNSLTSVLAKGSLVRVVGVVNKFYDTYQITSLQYDALDLDDPSNTIQLKENQEIEYLEITPAEFLGEKTIVVDDQEKTYVCAELLSSTSLTMKNLQVTKVSTTTNPDSDDCGAMTLTCDVDGYTVRVRTGVFKDENGELLTEEDFLGKTIDVQGVVEKYYENYQIRALLVEDIVIH